MSSSRPRLNYLSSADRRQMELDEKLAKLYDLGFDNAEVNNRIQKTVGFETIGNDGSVIYINQSNYELMCEEIKQNLNFRVVIRLAETYGHLIRIIPALPVERLDVNADDVDVILAAINADNADNADNDGVGVPLASWYRMMFDGYAKVDVLLNIAPHALYISSKFTSGIRRVRPVVAMKTRLAELQNSLTELTIRILLDIRGPLSSEACVYNLNVRDMFSLPFESLQRFEQILINGYRESAILQGHGDDKEIMEAIETVLMPIEIFASAYNPSAKELAEHNGTGKHCKITLAITEKLCRDVSVLFRYIQVVKANAVKCCHHTVEHNDRWNHKRIRKIIRLGTPTRVDLIGSQRYLINAIVNVIEQRPEMLDEWFDEHDKRIEYFTDCLTSGNVVSLSKIKYCFGCFDKFNIVFRMILELPDLDEDIKHRILTRQKPFFEFCFHLINKQAITSRAQDTFRIVLCCHINIYQFSNFLHRKLKNHSSYVIPQITDAMDAFLEAPDEAFYENTVAYAVPLSGPIPKEAGERPSSSAKFWISFYEQLAGEMIRRVIRENCVTSTSDHAWIMIKKDHDVPIEQLRLLASSLLVLRKIYKLTRWKTASALLDAEIVPETDIKRNVDYVKHSYSSCLHRQKAKEYSTSCDELTKLLLSGNMACVGTSVRRYFRVVNADPINLRKIQNIIANCLNIDKRSLPQIETWSPVLCNELIEKLHEQRHGQAAVFLKKLTGESTSSCRRYMFDPETKALQMFKSIYESCHTTELVQDSHMIMIGSMQNENILTITTDMESSIIKNTVLQFFELVRIVWCLRKAYDGEFNYDVDFSYTYSNYLFSGFDKELLTYAVKLMELEFIDPSSYNLFIDMLSPQSYQDESCQQFVMFAAEFFMGLTDVINDVSTDIIDDNIKSSNSTMKPSDQIYGRYIRTYSHTLYIRLVSLAVGWQLEFDGLVPTEQTWKNISKISENFVAYNPAMESDSSNFYFHMGRMIDVVHARKTMSGYKMYQPHKPEYTRSYLKIKITSELDD